MGHLRRMRNAYRAQLGSAVFLAVVAGFAALLEVVAITILVLLGKLTAEGKTTYAGDLAWLDRSFVLGVRDLVLIGIGAVIGRLLLQTWTSYIESRMAADYMAQQRNKLFAVFVDSSWHVKSNTRAADLQTMLTTNVDRGTHLLQSVAGAITALGNVLVLLASAMLLSPLFAVAIVAVAVVLFLALRPLSTWARRTAQADADVNMKYAREVLESVGVAQEVEVFGVGERVKRRVATTVESTRQKHKIAVLSGRLLGPLYHNFVLLIAFAGLATAAAGINVEVEVLGIVVMLLLRISSYTQGLQSVYHYILGKGVYLDQIAEAEEKYLRGGHPTGGKALEQIDALEFDDVHFAYKVDQPVLKGLSFDVAKGEMIGIVGPSGAGKSTLVRLLLGLYPPQEGTIRVNGESLGAISRDSWYRRIAYVPQEPQMIAGTVADNVRFFRADISLTEVERAARLASIHETIATLRGGYDADLGDTGGDLSGGQKQRMCIARALAGRPDLLILDEPTSALDPISEEAIQRTLGELHGQVTTIIVAHKLAMLKHCDRILVMHEGRIEAFDTPERLASSSNFYQRSQQLLGA